MSHPRAPIRAPIPAGHERQGAQHHDQSSSWAALGLSDAELAQQQMLFEQATQRRQQQSHSRPSHASSKTTGSGSKKATKGTTGAAGSSSDSPGWFSSFFSTIGGGGGGGGRVTRAREANPIVDWRVLPDWNSTYQRLYHPEQAAAAAQPNAGIEEGEVDESSGDETMDQKAVAPAPRATAAASTSTAASVDEPMDPELAAAIAASLAHPQPEAKQPPTAASAASAEDILAQTSEPLTEEQIADQRAFYQQPFDVQCRHFFQPPFAVDRALNAKIKLWQGDITRLNTDAIVNAANDGLWGGGGVCGAIFSAAGHWPLDKACKHIIHTTGRVPAGETRLTRGFDLPALFILHTVGPMDGDHQDLDSAYRSALDMAVKPELIEIGKPKKESIAIRSLAFCCISTGIFGFENEEAAMIALRAVRNWLDADPTRAAEIECIVFCIFLPKDKLIYERLMPIFFPVEPETEPVQSTTRAAYPPLMRMPKFDRRRRETRLAAAATSGSSSGSHRQ